MFVCVCTLSGVLVSSTQVWDLSPLFLYMCRCILPQQMRGTCHDYDWPCFCFFCFVFFPPLLVILHGLYRGTCVCVCSCVLWCLRVVVDNMSFSFPRCTQCPYAYWQLRVDNFKCRNVNLNVYLNILWLLIMAG